MPGKRWKLTSIGRAVFDSAMPPDLAVQMHHELESKILQGFTLHEPLQAIFVLLGSGKTPVTPIFDWSYWHKKFLVGPPDGAASSCMTPFAWLMCWQITDWETTWHAQFLTLPISNGVSTACFHRLRWTTVRTAVETLQAA